MPLRLVSFVSSLGSFFIIFLIVKRETRSNFSGILATGLFAATYQISANWFDLARVDSLFLFFLLMAFYLIKFGTSAKEYILAGVFVSLSFLTKQVALFMVLPVIFYGVFFKRRHFIFLIVTTITIIGISTLVLNYMHEGWYNYYVFSLPSQHPIANKMLVEFWLKGPIQLLSIAFCMSIFYIFAKHLSNNSQDCLFYLLMAVGMLGGAWISRTHAGAFKNVFIPAYAVLSILFGLSIQTVLEFIQTASPDKQKLMEVFIYLVCIIQFANLVYNPLLGIPSEEQLAANKKLVDTMRHIKGDVFMPYHGYLPILAGKNSHAHGTAIHDVLRGNKGQIRSKLIDDIRQAILRKRFSAIFFDFYWLLEEISLKDIGRYYTRQELGLKRDTVSWSMAMMKRGPAIYIPKTNSQKNQP